MLRIYLQIVLVQSIFSTLIFLIVYKSCSTLLYFTSSSTHSVYLYWYVAFPFLSAQSKSNIQMVLHFPGERWQSMPILDWYRGMGCRLCQNPSFHEDM